MTTKELQFCILNDGLKDTKVEAHSSEVKEWACIRYVNKNKDLYICESQVNVTVNIQTSFHNNEEMHLTIYSKTVFYNNK